MPRCITCGAGLHPERAEKYDYCMARQCQEKNARGLTMVAVGVNKSAEQYLILDEATREDLASGKYHDQRRGTFGPAAPRSVQDPARPAPPPPARPAASGRPPAPARRPAARAARPPWTAKQERLALLYNEQGIRPDEIAQRLGLSRYLVTQIILAARNRGKL